MLHVQLEEDRPVLRLLYMVAAVLPTAIPGSILLAQSVGDLAGSGGWAGAGLLGLVLAWLLLKHLPSKDEQIKGLIDRSDVQRAADRADFRNEIAMGREQCHKDSEAQRALTGRVLTEVLAFAERQISSEREAGDKRMLGIMSQMDKRLADHLEAITAERLVGNGKLP